MTLFRQSTGKSWVPSEGLAEDILEEGAFRAPAARLGLKFFLAAVSVLFMLLIIAYASRMAFEIWRPAPQPMLLWLNSLVLVLSSVAMHWAQYSGRRGNMGGVRDGLLVGGIFTLLFLAGQILAWRQLSLLGFAGAAIPAIGFFYLITGLHALHLVGGLVAWSKTTARVFHSHEISRVQQSVELCTLYWDFMLAVWLLLFALLFSGDNVSILLAICGIT